MSALTAAERQRRHRARERSSRAQVWRAEHPARWWPLLEAWAARGLRHPPSSGQLVLLGPWAELERGPAQLGQATARIARARARHAPTTYRLVAAIVRALGVFRQLAQDARDAFERPLSLDDPNAKRERGEGEPLAERPPVRQSKRPSPGQEHALSFRERMRIAGLDPNLWTKRGAGDDE